MALTSSPLTELDSVLFGGLLPGAARRAVVVDQNAHGQRALSSAAHEQRMREALHRLELWRAMRTAAIGGGKHSSASGHNL
jgi:hypothetical protein